MAQGESRIDGADAIGELEFEMHLPQEFECVCVKRRNGFRHDDDIIGDAVAVFKQLAKLLVCLAVGAKREDHIVVEFQLGDSEEGGCGDQDDDCRHAPWPDERRQADLFQPEADMSHAVVSLRIGNRANI